MLKHEIAVQVVVDALLFKESSAALSDLLRKIYKIFRMILKCKVKKREK